ncbi:penicillin-binding protein 2 [Treponema vincentii]|uniref:penicillin-binding protein 2 n=1 Tax=Treponema vincentii TaxID=69710 RepID=UPI0020A47347|nr:penicillin-binding protein 2 [Treponema vincentii]UTC46407.1 penicillin-binding protein 2 [Treponema vincentii]UTC59259.1 penicillin-binding protein 2 [Treponema vincentii]
MYEQDFQQINKRLKYFSIFVFCVLVIYIFRLFSMQIVQGAQFRKQSQTISQRSERIPAQRGEIFDRNANIPMVLNTNTFAVSVIPGEIPKAALPTVMARLAGLLQIPVAEVEKKLPQNIRRSFQSVEIRSNLPYEVITSLAENIDELPGVSWHSKPMRNYVETRSFSHILGYVGDITKEELKTFYNKGYTANTSIGKAGIEKYYDEWLRGEDGSEYRTVDAKGRLIENSTTVIPPKMGNNLILTIDRKIQELAEDALGPRIGAAVVLKPATGEILALVSYPYFDSNLFLNDNGNEMYAQLLHDTRNPLLNRAVNASYPPASTFKIVMSTAILAEKAFPPEKKVQCSGEVEYGNHLFRCHIRRPGHGYLDLRNALAQSCDIYYWTVCRDNLGIDKMVDYVRDFGYGKSAEIDLPSQASGQVPNPVWKERRFHEKWLGGDTMNMAIGQGFMLASPLQVANMVAMVVNGGVIYKPHLLKEVRSPGTNELVFEKKPEILQQSDIPPEVFAQVRADMRYTITDGTARYPMHNKIVQLAGKTGTAEVGLPDRWHSWMAAYGPYNAPAEDAVIVVVLVEAQNKWEWWAPYATNIIFQGIFADQTYEEALEALGGKRFAPAVRMRQE